MIQMDVIELIFTSCRPWSLCSQRLIIEDGNLVQKNLQLEWMQTETVHSDLRIKGQEYLRKVKEAWLGPKGPVSVVKDPASKPIQKKDKRLFG
jgi:uncharacterized membrane protein YcaP (DUF421 family)